MRLKTKEAPCFLSEFVTFLGLLTVTLSETQAHCCGEGVSGDSRQDIQALEKDFLSDAESGNVKE